MLLFRLGTIKIALVEVERLSSWCPAQSASENARTSSPYQRMHERRARSSFELYSCDILSIFWESSRKLFDNLDKEFPRF